MKFAASLFAGWLALTSGAVAQPAHDWSGFYAGAHLGGAAGEENDNLSETIDPDFAFDPQICPILPLCIGDNFDINGVIGGLHAGYNMQSGRFVFGLEASFDGSLVEGDHDHSGGTLFEDDILPIPIPVLFDGNLAFEQRWQAALVGKAGAAFDNVLVYALGGVAVSRGHLNYAGDLISIFGGPFPFNEDDRQTHIGWTVGLGGEYALTENLSARLEARYTDFGEQTYGFFSIPDQPPLINVDVDFNQVSVTAGLSYHF